MLGAWVRVSGGDDPHLALEGLSTVYNLLSKQLKVRSSFPCCVACSACIMQILICRSGSAQEGVPVVAATVCLEAVNFFRLTSGAVEPVTVLPLADSRAAERSISSGADWLASAFVLFRCRLPVELQVSRRSLL